MSIQKRLYESRIRGLDEAKTEFAVVATASGMLIKAFPKEEQARMYIKNKYSQRKNLRGNLGIVEVPKSRAPGNNMKKYGDIKVVKESVELGEMTLKPKVSKKYPDRTSDGFEGPYTSGQRAGRMFYYDTKADRFYDADSTEFKKRLKESVEVEEAHMVKHSDGNYVMTTDGEKVKTVSRDKKDAKRFSKSVAKRIANQPTSKHVDGKFVPNKGTKSGVVVREDVELDEMSAKQHYAKFKRGGRGKGFVVSSPIDRDRYPNREREGLEGPYKSRKSGKIFYYDKKAGKYYDTDSDMYLAVNDVMEEKEKIKVKLDPKKKIGYTIHNVGPGGKKTLVKSRDMPGKKDVG